MDSPRRTARLAGLLYLVSSIPGAFALLYVPGKLVVEGNASATADRLRTSGSLLRLGIGAEILGMTLFVFVALVLYRLFRPTSPEPALWMVVLILLPMPISFLSVVPEVAALNLAGAADGSGYLSPIAALQRDALAYFCLDLHGWAVMVAQVFWGLWLFPFAICVIRSGFIPRFLGVLLVIAGCGHLAEAVAGLVFPQHAAAVDRIGGILTPAELPMIFWLLIWGARARPRPVSAAPV